MPKPTQTAYTGSPTDSVDRSSAKKNIRKEVVDKLTGWWYDNFESFEDDMCLIKKPEDRVKAFIEVTKLIAPKVRDPEEEDASNRLNSLLYEKLFMGKQVSEAYILEEHKDDEPPTTE